MMTSECLTSINEAVVAPGYCAYDIPVDVLRPRGVVAVGTTDFLALERGTSSVVFFRDANGDDVPDTRRVVAQADGLNHGLALDGGYLYASSDTTVYRWSVANDNTFLEPVGEEQVVIDNMAAGGHVTRTLIFDDAGRLYVSIGSDNNVDADSSRSRLRRFDVSNSGNFPLDFDQDGELFADGLRNEVGLAWDRHGVLWGVENSADNLRRDDLGGDIHFDNPGEELNRFREMDIGKHWGYPYCWTEFDVPEPFGDGQGTVWAWPSFLEDGEITDAQCREEYIPPVLTLQAHSAPLGIKFYEWTAPENRPADCPPAAAFPKEFDGYAVIAYHGSWNRAIPTGYKVVYVPMDENGDPTGEPVDLLSHEPPNAKWGDGFRPVDVDFDACGRLLVTSDGTRSGGTYVGSKVVRIEYTIAEDPATISPSMDAEMDTLQPSDESTSSPTSEETLISTSNPSETTAPTSIRRK